MFRVIITQSDQMGVSRSRFGFNKVTDALEFVQTCLECGDEGTLATIQEQEIEED